MYRFEEQTRDRLRELAPSSTALVPVGSTEQHGPHLPVCTDTTIVTALAHRAAEAAEVPVVVTPTLPYGFAHHHLPFGGTVSLALAGYLDALTDIGRSLAVDGFRRIVFLNGHGGNDGAVRSVGDRIVFERELDVHVAGTSYWTCAAEVLAGTELGVGPVPGHAGGFETSCMLALRPDLVRRELAPAPEPDLQPLAYSDIPGATIRRAGVWAASDGRTDDSRHASAEAGERALALVAASVTAFLTEFHHSVP
ncbi:creatinine amidohydrolase [Actinocatenispora thailandica]|uniref:Creatinine amidohydrolase n=1 Tax=Actinocatenispora thailandica TaxID=227318 RepID=A0A7R7HWQ5_9ACTN|nr:creatininase family protein [Actinocatenispora thailandica]BCJ34234.1 creatinine amidohydrolase [Actinocatenispora thailandica]